MSRMARDGKIVKVKANPSLKRQKARLKPCPTLGEIKRRSALTGTEGTIPSG